MRDGQIIDMNQRRASNEYLLYKQIQFLNTRMEAFERVLSSRSLVLKAIWNPDWFKREVNRIQLLLMQEHDQKVREASQQAQEEAKKPKLIVPTGNGIKSLAAILIVLSLSSCMSLGRHNAILQESRDNLKVQAERYNQEIEFLSQDIRNKTERLRMLDHVDADGRLLPLDPLEETDWDIDAMEGWERD